MVHSSRVVTAAKVQVYDHRNSNRAKIQTVLEKIGEERHPEVQSTIQTLQDFLAGAPARHIIIAYNNDSKIIGALTFVDKPSAQEIASIGYMEEDTAKSLIRALDHSKALSVAANEPHHALFNSLGFRHTDELEPGVPSEMEKAPPEEHLASRTSGDYPSIAKRHQALRLENNSSTYFHGTNSESAARQIIKKGIQPRDVTEPGYKGRGWLAPPKGRVYITPSLAYAAIYALGGDCFGSPFIPGLDRGAYGYIFEVSGNTLAGEVQPDEDSIGEILYKALLYSDAVRRLARLEGGAVPRSGSELDNLHDKISEYGRHPINTPGNEEIRDHLIALAKSKLTEGQLKRVRQGLYAEWARSGKKLQKFLPDNISQALLTWGSHVSHSGEVAPTRAWRFKKKDAQSISSPAEIMQICDEFPLVRTEPSMKSARIKKAIALADCFCTNSDCDDFEKKGLGNLTQEFAYGVDSDRHMLYCTTCKKRFSETKCTEFFSSKLNGDDISGILTKAADGMSIRDIGEKMDLNKDTVNNVLLKAKEACEKYISEGKTGLPKELVSDMALETKQKGSLKDFIDEVLVPELSGDDSEKEEDKPTKDKEAHIIKVSRLLR